MKVMTLEDLEEGEELLIDYGDLYFAQMMGDVSGASVLHTWGIGAHTHARVLACTPCTPPRWWGSCVDGVWVGDVVTHVLVLFDECEWAGQGARISMLRVLPASCPRSMTFNALCAVPHSASLLCVAQHPGLLYK